MVLKKSLGTLGFLVLAACGGPEEEMTGLDRFAQCLTDKGAVMYGVEDCFFCGLQKDAFGDSFEYIAYIGCDEGANASFCAAKGFEGYPTWEIGGERYIGCRLLDELSEISGCEKE